MPESNNIAILRRILEDLRGGGFNTSITVNGFTFTGLKVVSFENGVVMTVTANGLVRATPIEQVITIDF